MLIKLEATSNIVNRGKLGSKWNGPFKVTKVVKVNIYHFQDIEKKSLPHA